MMAVQPLVSQLHPMNMTSRAVTILTTILVVAASNTFCATVEVADSTLHVNTTSAPTYCDSLPWDASLTYRVQSWGGEGMHSASAIVSDALLPATFGIPLGLFAYGHLGTDNMSRSRYATETGLQALVTELITYSLVVGAKAITDRDRPFIAFPTCIVGYQHPYGTSMPSGHAAGSSALATTLILRYPQWYVIAPAAAYAAFTGFARLNLGVHYITDVVVGYAIGIGTALLVDALSSSLFDAADPLLPPEEQFTRLPLLSITLPL